MYKLLCSVFVSVAFLLSSNAVVAAGLIAKPTSEQVLNFAEALAKTPSADKKVAAEALQKWMDGKLSEQEAVKFKDALKFPQKESSKTIKPMGSTEQCAACMAACCAWWGCNPACIAGCVAGICKN